MLLNPSKSAPVFHNLCRVNGMIFFRSVCSPSWWREKARLQSNSWIQNLPLLYSHLLLGILYLTARDILLSSVFWPSKHFLRGHYSLYNEVKSISVDVRATHIPEIQKLKPSTIDILEGVISLFWRLWTTFKRKPMRFLNPWLLKVIISSPTNKYILKNKLDFHLIFFKV